MMIRCISQALDSHEIIVASLLSLQSVNSEKQTDRIKNLLRWSRGTRYFLHDLIFSIGVAVLPEINELLSQNIMRVEKCRMKLWNPITPLKDVPDHDEMMALQNALTLADVDSDACKTLGNNIISQKGCSLVVRHCVLILGAKLNMDSREN
jgi:hypothetical protein